VPKGEVGRIFVGNTFPFEGYTGGGGKQIIEGLMSSGDVGYFDNDGLLYVSGRDDEMIVCGGENVFPAEVEDLISGHPGVVEATALGVEDKEWGHRLRAFVVRAEHAGELDEATIKNYVKDNLARYKVPAMSSSSTNYRAIRPARSSNANSARSIRTDWPLRVARQAEQTLGDDVELHLGGAAVDRGRAAGQQVLVPRPDGVSGSPTMASVPYDATANSA
jgi:long-subunit acyl-CoA synthetase (AMP-forming)